MKALLFVISILGCSATEAQDTIQDTIRMYQAPGLVPTGQVTNCPCRWVHWSTEGAVIVKVTVDTTCAIVDKRVVASPDSSLNKLALSTISSEFENEMMRIHHFVCDRRTFLVGVEMYKPEEMDR